ncbi:DUF2786 domain-containing protein [Pseudonocardia alaniniphila]|uniref:DUF2786 domain-containing protein n=1 Tax=Pseudonocardia alaniniphila TaxID=75291 RepID=A0ABS9TID1_9PSEU|nr:DUF2786 domain-containing protein [Pseudonocardia alaniniphila]MCH6168281.1 DUF2786 domain-containing protein [Pseudonocardia alaniniphila]
MGLDKLDTIRKLLAKAERAATAAEAETYTAKAMELMARHGVDAALLAAARPGSDRIGPQRIAMDDPYSAGKARLLGWTATALGCRWVLHGARGGKVAAVTVFGHESDRQRVELLYTSLQLQASTQLVRVRPPALGESVAAYRRSWLHGFAVEVHRRLTGAEERAAGAARSETGTSGPSVALVLADRREQVDRAYSAAFPRLASARRSVLSGSGFAAGARAGERADLGLGGLGAGNDRHRALGAR